MTAKIGQKMFAKIATLGKIDAPAPSKKPPQIVAMKIDGWSFSRKIREIKMRIWPVIFTTKNYNINGMIFEFHENFETKNATAKVRVAFSW